MGYNAAPLEKLIEEFGKFPGIGRKGATRMAYQVLSMSDEDAAALAGAIQNAHTKLHRCRVCQNYTEAELCPICASAKRDHSIICVVETPRDVQAFERTRRVPRHVPCAARPHQPDGRHRCRAAHRQGAAGPAGRRRGERGHHGDEPHRRGRGDRHVSGQSSSSRWASRPPGWPTVCRWVPAWSTPTKRRCTGPCLAEGNCDGLILGRIYTFFKNGPCKTIKI